MTPIETVFDLSGRRVWVAGHRGLVGSALVRRLEKENCEIIVGGRDQVDLTRQDQVERWVQDRRPDAVIVAAAKVGGILANDTYPADFLYLNLMIEANVIEACYRSGVQKLLFLGSNCIYPRMADQPIREDSLLTGPLEPTNEPYAVAKIVGIKLAQSYRRQFGVDYISAMPANLYGPGDNFDLASGHMLPALVRKAHEAKIGGKPSFQIWGTGSPRRECLHVDDCADALVHLMRHYSGAEQVNVGSGHDLPIRSIAGLVAEVVGFKGRIDTDPSKPDGTPRKLMSAAKLRALGWSPRIELRDGLASLYQWCLESGTFDA